MNKLCPADSITLPSFPDAIDMYGLGRVTDNLSSFQCKVKVLLRGMDGRHSLNLNLLRSFCSKFLVKGLRLASSHSSFRPSTLLCICLV